MPRVRAAITPSRTRLRHALLGRLVASARTVPAHARIPLLKVAPGTPPPLSRFMTKRRQAAAAAEGEPVATNQHYG
jgi:hypothetical protein